MSKNFSDTGYVIIKQAISKKLFKNIQDDIYNTLKIKGVNSKIKYDKFCKITKHLRIKEYDFAMPIFQSLHFKGLLKAMFLEKKFHNKMVELLGSDLAFAPTQVLPLICQRKLTQRRIIILKTGTKKFGLEQAHLRFRFGLLIHKSNKNGQMQIIEDSHKWGHIPHMDRRPLSLPKNYITKELNLNYGDVIIFSTLLLHRSLPTKFPRLSLPMLTKNFKSNDISFQDIRSFENYSFSELTKIQRILGNHFLSPYRLKKL